MSAANTADASSGEDTTSLVQLGATRYTTVPSVVEAITEVLKRVLDNEDIHELNCCKVRCSRPNKIHQTYTFEIGVRAEIPCPGECNCMVRMVLVEVWREAQQI